MAGLVGTANVAAYLLGTVAVSGLARRLAPAALIRGGLLATCLGLFVLSQADGAVALAVGLGLTGVGGAFIWVPAPGLAGSVVRATVGMTVLARSWRCPQGELDLVLRDTDGTVVFTP